jgi:hypothetical protein
VSAEAVAAFGDRPVGELRSEEIAAWRIGLFGADWECREIDKYLRRKGNVPDR